MKLGGYFFWLALLIAGSVLWLTPRPWAVVMGRYIVFTAAFVGVTAPRWRTGVPWPPRAVVAVQIANLLPMVVVGSSFLSRAPSPLLKILYLLTAAAVLAVN